MATAGFEPGALVYALWLDGENYRAKVLSKTPGSDKYLVQYLGYSDSREVCMLLIPNDTALQVPASSLSVMEPDEAAKWASEAAAIPVVGQATASVTAGTDRAPPPVPKRPPPIAVTAANGVKQAPGGASPRAMISPRGAAKSEDEKRAMRRMRIAKELLETERTYVENLTALVDVFITPLTQQETKDHMGPSAATSTPTVAVTDTNWVQPPTRQVSKSFSIKALGMSTPGSAGPASPSAGGGPPPLQYSATVANLRTGSAGPSAGAGAAAAASETASLLTPKRRQTLFSNIALIRDLNARFLTQLAERIDKWTQATSVGDLFVQFAPFFKMYSQYVNNHYEATILLNKLMTSEKHKKLQQFLAACSANPRIKGLDLASLLILPIQRIPRYKLLLQTLFDNTDTSHQDYGNLQKSLSLVGDVAHHINEAVRQQQNSAHIVQLQSQFSGDPQLVAVGRHFIRQGSLKKQSRNNNTRRYEFFLFNDLLVYAEMSGLTLSIRGLKNLGRGLFKLHGKMPLDAGFDVHDMPDKEKEVNRMMIVSAAKSFVVYAETPQEKKDWLRDLRAAMDALKGRIKSGPDAGKADAKDAKPGTGSGCSCCGKIFFNFPSSIVPSFVCAVCDKLVCDDCSKGRSMDHKDVDGAPGRMCDNCVKKTREAKEKELAAQEKAELAGGAPAAPPMDGPIGALVASTSPPGSRRGSLEKPGSGASVKKADKATDGGAAGKVSVAASPPATPAQTGAAAAIGGMMQQELAKIIEQKRNRAATTQVEPAKPGLNVGTAAPTPSPRHRRSASFSQKQCAVGDCATARVPGRAYCSAHLTHETSGAQPTIAVKPSPPATGASKTSPPAPKRRVAKGPDHFRTLSAADLQSLGTQARAADIAGTPAVSAAALRGKWATLRPTQQAAAGAVAAANAANVEKVHSAALPNSTPPAWAAALSTKIKRRTIGDDAESGNASAATASGGAQQPAAGVDATALFPPAPEGSSDGNAQGQGQGQGVHAPAPGTTSASLRGRSLSASQPSGPKTFAEAGPAKPAAGRGRALPAKFVFPSVPEERGKKKAETDAEATEATPADTSTTDSTAAGAAAAVSVATSPSASPAKKKRGPPPLPQLPPPSIANDANSLEHLLSSGDSAGTGWQTSEDVQYLRRLVQAALSEVAKLKTASAGAAASS